MREKSRSGVPQGSSFDTLIFFFVEVLGKTGLKVKTERRLIVKFRRPQTVKSVLLSIKN